MIETFGEYIKSHRKKLGFSLEKVASYLNIDAAILRKIEREEQRLSINLVNPLAQILNIEQKMMFNKYYASKIMDEIKHYSNYKDVLDIVDEQLELYKLEN